MRIPDHPRKSSLRFHHPASWCSTELHTQKRRRPFVLLEMPGQFQDNATNRRLRLCLPAWNAHQVEQRCFEGPPIPHWQADILSAPVHARASGPCRRRNKQERQPSIKDARAQSFSSASGSLGTHGLSQIGSSCLFLLEQAVESLRGVLENPAGLVSGTFGGIGDSFAQ
jgi:hypothetical protein